MATPDKKKELTYECFDDQAVHLSVTIGNAQYGLTDVRKDGALLARDVRIIDIPLGIGGSIVDSEVVIRTIINDINPYSNRAIASYMLTGGPDAMTFDMEGEVDTHGDHLYFRVDLTFEV